MEYQHLFNMILGVVCSGLGWWLNAMHQAHEALRKQIHEIAVDLPKNYVAKVDMHELRDALFQRLDRLEQKIDRQYEK